MSKDFEFAKFGTNKLIINTSTDSICIQFTREAGKLKGRAAELPSCCTRVLMRSFPGFG